VGCPKSPLLMAVQRFNDFKAFPRSFYRPKTTWLRDNRNIIHANRQWLPIWDRAASNSSRLMCEEIFALHKHS